MKRISYGAAAVLMLCFPAFINKSPILSTDARSYYLGGHAVVERLLSIYAKLTGVASLATQETTSQARGVRSAFYSLFVYALANAGTLWLVIAIQAALAAWMIILVQKTCHPGTPLSHSLWFVGWIAPCTTAPWSVSIVLPDIFTPLMVLCIICLTVSWEQLRPRTRIGVALLFGASIVMHITNLPIAVVLILLGMVMNWDTLRTRMAPWLTVTTMMGGAVIAMLMVGVIGFGQWTIAPQSPPFMLARSIGDGPGALYLRQHCPQIGMAMCRHLDRLDVSVDDFLWHDNGVYSVVSAEERAALRAEDKRLFFLAAKEHPAMQARAIVRHTLEQLVDFSLFDITIPSYATITPADMTITEQTHAPDWLIPFIGMHYMIVIGSVILLVLYWRAGIFTRGEKQLVTMAATAVVLNAFAGSMSMVAPRYEARIMWLIPLAMASLFWTFERRGNLNARSP